MFGNLVSLGNLPSQIESSLTIQIGISNSDDDFNTNLIPSQRPRGCALHVQGCRSIAFAYGSCPYMQVPALKKGCSECLGV